MIARASRKERQRKRKRKASYVKEWVSFAWRKSCFLWLDFRTLRWFNMTTNGLRGWKIKNGQDKISTTYLVID